MDEGPAYAPGPRTSGSAQVPGRGPRFVGAARWSVVRAPQVPGRGPRFVGAARWSVVPAPQVPGRGPRFVGAARWSVVHRRVGGREGIGLDLRQAVVHGRDPATRGSSLRAGGLTGRR
ncbi:hypothetical protein FTX61_06550 [Nitriliruptoraceae bacterium ZYF776]|nr:hypothetical protein [Profundirhabdus halotolerans]